MFETPKEKILKELRERKWKSVEEVDQYFEKILDWFEEEIRQDMRNEENFYN